MKKPKQRLSLGREVVKALVTDSAPLRQVAGGRMHSVGMCDSTNPICALLTRDW